MAIVNSIFADNIRLLKTEASKTAYQGVAIAMAAIFVATCLTAYINTGSVTLDGLWAAQKTNVALWILNAVPFIFGIWGQYSSSVMAYQAGAMMLDQTRELRTRADTLEKKSNHVSTHDNLTDLPNRALFYDRVERSIIEIARTDKAFQSLAILLIEIENLKDIYDTLGRNSSDSVLKQIATRLQAVSSERDVVARIDGNIFGIMARNEPTNPRAEHFAQQIQKALESPFLLDRLYVAVHPNIGIVHFPDHGQDVDALVQRAGIALHIAQKSSKGYALYEQSFDKHTPLRLTLMSELRHAIERDQGLDLFYQPQISINTGQIWGVEALLRWNHPVHGFITPDEFIPMAERNRMTKQLTQWVLRRAFRDCANWRQQGVEFSLSVNLSARDLHDSDLPNLISGVAAAAGIQADWITLEITEGSVMSEPETALEIIGRLHQMGYHFSIDDFGTGYSSMAYLKKMPLAELKIDKSFVIDILVNENDAAIVKATVNLAQNLGLKVIAEGVENREILTKLMDYGCDIAQGYHFSKPFPVEKFNQWLAEFNQSR